MNEEDWFLVGRGAIWRFLAVEIACIAAALLLLALPPLRMLIDGIRITGTITAIEQNGMATVQDPSTELSYEVEMWSPRTIGETTTVVVDPRSRTTVLTPVTTLVYASFLAALAVLLVVGWPVLWSARRHRCQSNRSR